MSRITFRDVLVEYFGDKMSLNRSIFHKCLTYYYVTNCGAHCLGASCPVFFFGRFGPNVFRPLGVGVTLLNPTQVHGSYFPYPTLLDNTYPTPTVLCLSPYSILMTFFPALGYLIIPTHSYCTPGLQKFWNPNRSARLRTWVRQSQIVTKTNDSSFSYKSVSEIDYLSNTL